MSTHRKKLALFGAGGHAKVVMDASEKQSAYNIFGLYDDNYSLKGQQSFGYPVLGTRADLIEQKLYWDALIITIGSNQIRQQLTEFFLQQSIQFATVIHPSAQISRGVTINEGSVVFATSVVNAGSCIGKGVIINTGARIDHDCKVDDYVHIAPGATLCGGVIVGSNSFIGAGATIIAGISIGKDVIVGAGSTVIRDLPDGARVAGSPAVNLRDKNASE